MFPKEIYLFRIIELNERLSRLKKRRSTIAWMRLLTIVLAVSIIYYLYPTGLLIYATITLLSLTAFIRLVFMTVINKSAIENLTRLVQINQQELEIALGQFSHLPDGAALSSDKHDYAHDLNIFGRASLYQYINRTTSEQGHTTLGAWLMQTSHPSTILQRQSAVRELAADYEWRQQFQAYGGEQTITIETEHKITGWLKVDNSFSNNIIWKWLKWIYPVFTLVLLILYLANIIPANWFTAAVFFFFIFSLQVSKRIFSHYVRLNQIVPQLSILSKSAAWIERARWNADYLCQLRQNFIQEQKPASIAINGVKSILDKFDIRLNPLIYFPLNTFLLWDLQLVFQLEKWRKQHKSSVAQWFSALGDLEAISSIANLHFNHPSWSFPILDLNHHGTIQAQNLGHPLIQENKRVCNSFFSEHEAQLALITGSNMAGKSTFLRSIGVNVILAMMGAPTCASSLKLSPMRIISSMRVADNLEESTSTFYAELKKLKSIIDAVNSNQKVFILLDEILRGTNSLDRHIGSKALIRQLIKRKAVGMLATHDVELAQLQEEFPNNIHNYHFDVQVSGEELYFDYKLKDGICTSLNASILMKKIGIEL